MRPYIDVEQSDVYECFDCVAQVAAPERRECAACGGELRHIGRSRDL
ncbi:MAG: rubrerythrin-like domain-containing protein [Haloarculaceae archaeon]